MKRSILALAFMAALSATAAHADVLTGNYVQGNFGADVPTNHSSQRDDSLAGSVAVGHDFGKVRTELEYLRLGTGSLDQGKVNGNVVNLNVIAEPVTISGFTPFVIGGVGYGFFDGQGVGTTRNGLVYNVGAGVSYAVDAHWSLVGEYRYLLADDVKVRQNSGAQDTFKTNLVLAGVRYQF